MSISEGLPSDIQLEKEILGACFQEDRTFLGDVRHSLSPDDFSLEVNRRILRALCVIADRGDPLTCTTVFGELRAMGIPESLGVLIEYDANLAWALGKNIERLKTISGRRKLLIASEHLRNLAADPSIDLASCFEQARRAIQAVEEGSAAPAEIETAEQIVQSVGGIQEFFKPRIGIPTPWNEFNETTGGWNNSELSIVAARASMGKTSFALNAIYHAAKNGKAVVFYSCEMNQESILKRLISLITGITFIDLQRGELNTSERRAASEALASIAELPIRVVAAAGKTAGWIRTHVERLYRKGLCQFAVLDYIGLVRGTDRGNNNRSRELGDICRQLKLIAAELNIPFVALAQLNRAVESRNDKRPAMSDMRDSGELEEHGDLIALLYRQDYYERDNPSIEGTAELIIAKQRNGPTPTIPLRFDYRRGKFYDPKEG